MFNLNLGGEWMCALPGKPEFEVTVPGCFDTYVAEKDYAAEVVFTKSFVLEKTLPSYRLCFGAVSYYCETWLNGTQIGSHEGMWDRFYLDCTDALQEGENLLKVVVTKPGYHESDRFPLRQVLSGFLPDVICTFGGIWEQTFLLGAENFFVENHFAKGSAKGDYEIQLQLWAAQPCNCVINGQITDKDNRPAGDIAAGVYLLQQGLNNITLKGSLPGPHLWDTEEPNLYTYSISISAGSQQQEICKNFGFRDIAAEGNRILLNGRPVYPRGVLHWGYYDDIIIPRPGKDTICGEILSSKQQGFNLIKHCLYIPGEEYFQLADQLGMLLWVELPLWLPEPTPQLNSRIKREYPAIVSQISGHPSVIMMSLGCELNDSVDTDILEEMYHLVRRESGALVRDNSGSGECYGGHTVDFADFNDYHFYGELQNMENLMEVFTPTWRSSQRPWLYGEFCDSDSMRDLATVRASRKVDMLWWEQGDPVTNPISILKPDFYAGEHDSRMESQGIRADMGVIGPLSLRHSLIHRKTTLEQTRSFPEISGYVITCIRDVPIATSGIFDDNMRPKFEGEIFSRFNNDTVLLPAWDLTREWLGADRVSSRERYNFFSGGEYGLHILASCYGGGIEGGSFSWKLTDRSGAVVKDGGKSAIPQNLQNGTVQEIFYIMLNLPETATPKEYTLHGELSWPGGRAENAWPVFVYPQPKPEGIAPKIYDPCRVFANIDKVFPDAKFISEQDIAALGTEEILFCSIWCDAGARFAEKGGRVFCTEKSGGALGAEPMPFWREGMLRPYTHEILEGCITENPMEDLRYFSLTPDCAFLETALEEKGFAAGRPILHRYDCRSWLRHCYMGEYAFGKGRVILSTLRMEGGMGKQPISVDKSPFALHLAEKIYHFLKKTNA